MLLEDFPGRAEAAAQEEYLRSVAMMPINLRLCGIEVRQFTPRHFLILDRENSPFFAGGEIELDHVLQFFWVVSPLFVFLNGRNAALVARRRQAVMDALFAIDLTETVDAIREYIDQALLDRPAGAGSGGRAIASFAAILVDEIATAYHWRDTILDRHGQPVPEGGILDIPFARLFQYGRLIQYRRNPEVEPTNRLSDRAERDWIRSQAAAASAPASPPAPTREHPYRKGKRKRKGRR